MDEKRIWAGLSMVVGLIILLWWFSSEWGAVGLVSDCWIGGFCLVLMVPGIVGLILVVVGLIVLLKK
jgi:hypothetical protein